MSTTAFKQSLQEVVTDLDPDRVDAMLDWLVAAGMSVVTEPRPGLVMMTVSDSTGCDFHAGEVLVTCGEVSIDGSRGYGAVMGDDPSRALLLAGCEALGGAAVKDPDAAFAGMVREAVADAEKRRDEVMSLAAGTRVVFESMAEEEPLS